ncbi:TetR/AcrR family transcriptional regulator [Roseovarius sp. TE539]|nr:TetR/AcrR family transcriptional regulator [Roseovarius sp. TE539]
MSLLKSDISAKGPAGTAAGQPAQGDSTRRKNKREVVLLKAAELIARHGIDGTSMRDIATAVDMLPGSLYYHFSSKEEMVLAIHERVVGEMTRKVEQAIEDARLPWDRLERAAVAHLEALLETGNMVAIISPHFEQHRIELNRELRAQRNAYEVMFRGLFDALDLPEGVDRALLRLQLLGALNWVPVWYDPGKDKTAGEIARTFVSTIRAGLD